jgi:hypothetical protein
MKNPQSIEEMFQMIDGIENEIAKQKPFKQITSHDVIGVPVRYYLVPLKFYLNVKIEKLFLVLKDEVLNKFENMLTLIRDYNHINCLRNKIIELEKSEKMRVKYQLGKILFDENSAIFKKIDVEEKKLIEINAKYLKLSMETFRDYKVHEKTEKDIVSLVENYEREFNQTENSEKITNFYSQAKQDMIEAKYSDAPECVRFFTNSLFLNEWYRSGNGNKVLLRTNKRALVDPNQADNFFYSFYNMSVELNKRGFEIAVAFPSVDESFSLSIKLNDKEETYEPDDIVFAIEMVNTLLGVASPHRQLFYKIYFDLENMPFSLDENSFKDLNNMIRLVISTKIIRITDSELETRNVLTSKDGKRRFFVPLDVLNTCPRAIDLF